MQESTLSLLKAQLVAYKQATLLNTSGESSAKLEIWTDVVSYAKNSRAGTVLSNEPH